MKSDKGFIVYTDYDSSEDKTEITLYGKLENGKSFVAIAPFKPYFFIRESDISKLKILLAKFEQERTELSNFSGEKVIKISNKSQSELNKLVSAIHKKDIETYEADVKPSQRYLIDNDLLNQIEISGESEPSQKIDRVYRNFKIKPTNYKPKLKVISLDIESNKDTGELYCIGMFGEEYKKSFIISKQKIQDTVSCANESDLLEKFKQELIKYDPDIITGWNVIDFDLAYLKERFIENKVQFDIGRDNSNPRIRIEKNFFKSSTADISGRQVLDALNLIKDPFIKEAPSIKNSKFDSYTLEDVSQAILGKGKLIKGKDRHNEIDNLYKEGKHKDLVDYNMQDCILVYEILKKTNTIELAIERSCLTGMPLNKITASILSFDSLYIREARKRGLVSPSTVYEEKAERIKGGYVMESKPGLYNNLVVLDFKSLYPSLIKTFNIDPSSYLGKKGEKNSIESPNKVYFKNEDGILPEIITKLHEEREKAKREKRELSSYAIKTIMNSFWGVLASPNCRYFDLDMANAITSFARWTIQLTAKKIEEQKYKVIYSDTDSVFVETHLSKAKAYDLGNKLAKDVNDFYKDYIKKNFNRDSYLELQFEKLYLAFMFPPIRDSDKGSKKRYAGLIEKSGKEEVVVVGLEAIRGDWTEAAQDFQRELLWKIFHEEEFVQYIRDYVKKLKSGKLDSKLIYRKSITKSLEKYTKTTPPHVKAARQLDNMEGSIIQYYITDQGPEPIQKLKHPLDYKHYIEKQIKPIADTILFFFHKKFDDIISSSSQTKLFG